MEKTIWETEAICENSSEMNSNGLRHHPMEGFNNAVINVWIPKKRIIS